MARPDRCVNAGMLMEQWANPGAGKAYMATPRFPAELRGSVHEDAFVVPHSELAMRTRAAGRPIVAFACRNNGRSCGVVWLDPDGGCGFASGLPSEVMSPDVLRTLQYKHGYNFGFGGVHRRRRTRRRR